MLTCVFKCQFSRRKFYSDVNSVVLSHNGLGEDYRLTALPSNHSRQLQLCASVHGNNVQLYHDSAQKVYMTLYGKRTQFIYVKWKVLSVLYSPKFNMHGFHV